MDIKATLHILQSANQLKRTPRTGWVQRGIPNAEDVAAHSFGVVFTALVLAQLIDDPPDLAQVLAMAALHDLPEGRTTDIPTPAWRYLPAGVKSNVERGTMRDILGDAPFAADWMALWEELDARETAVSRLVHDADKLEMFLQAHNYEQQTGNRQLQEFWARPHRFYHPQAQAIYEELRRQRGDFDG